MIYIPLIWFTILTVFFLKKDGIVPSTYVSLLFLITSFFSVLMFHNNMIETNVLSSISVVPTFVYCLLITLSIVPISKYNYKKISIKYNDKVFDILTYFYFAYFLFIIVFLRDELLIRTAASNIVDLKNEIYKGGGFDPKVSLGMLWPIMAFFLLLGGCPFIMFPIFFISIIKGGKKWWYYIMAFLGTTPLSLMGMLNIDRSSTFKWIIFSVKLFSCFLNASIASVKSFLSSRS